MQGVVRKLTTTTRLNKTKRLSKKMSYKQTKRINNPAKLKNILVVDDEDIILEVAKAMIQTMGHKIIVCGSGQEAIKIYKENWENIDLVIFDLIMPQFSGKETFEILKEINPQVKGILISGLQSGQEVQEILALGCSEFLPKPLEYLKLKKIIENILMIER